MDDSEYNMNVIKMIPYWEDSYQPFLLCEQLNKNGRDRMVSAGNK